MKNVKTSLQFLYSLRLSTHNCDSIIAYLCDVIEEEFAKVSFRSLTVTMRDIQRYDGENFAVSIHRLQVDTEYEK